VVSPSLDHLMLAIYLLRAEFETEICWGSFWTGLQGSSLTCSWYAPACHRSIPASRVNSMFSAGLLVSSLLAMGFNLPAVTVLCQPLGPLMSSLPAMGLSLLAIEVSCCWLILPLVCWCRLDVLIVPPLMFFCAALILCLVTGLLRLILDHWYLSLFEVGTCV